MPQNRMIREDDGRRWNHKRSPALLKRIAKYNSGRILTREEVCNLFGYSTKTFPEDVQIYRLGLVTRLDQHWWLVGEV